MGRQPTTRHSDRDPTRSVTQSKTRSGTGWTVCAWATTGYACPTSKRLSLCFYECEVTMDVGKDINLVAGEHSLGTSAICLHRLDLSSQPTLQLLGNLSSSCN